MFNQTSIIMRKIILLVGGRKQVTIFFTLVLCFLCTPIKAQVVYNETFDSYPIGVIGTDHNAVIPGYGGWYTKSLYTQSTNAFTIINEQGKGKVYSIISPISRQETYVTSKNNLSALVDKRQAGNDVIKFEIDYFTGPQNPLNTAHSFIYLHYNFQPYINRIITFQHAKATGICIVNSYNAGKTTDNFVHDMGGVLPFNTWVTLIVYLDYNNQKAYFNIPHLNKVVVGDFLKKATSTHLIEDYKPDAVTLSTGFNYTHMPQPGYVRVGYDNIKITALNEVPPHILNTAYFSADKFNLYPNPATNVVTINNTENMLVNQVVVYDTTGKQISTQNFNAQATIQLNVEHLASGTYMLHITTHEGTAVKKLVKK